MQDVGWQMVWLGKPMNNTLLYLFKAMELHLEGKTGLDLH